MAARFDWEKIRAEYEVGATQSELARTYGCCRKAIHKHIVAEGWMQDISASINRLTEAKVAGLVTGCDPKKKAEALDKAAQKKAAVIERHKQEWADHQKWIDSALADGNFEAAKLAKITAETIRIRQDGERRAWGIVDTDVRPKVEQVKILPLYADEAKQ